MFQNAAVKEGTVAMRSYVQAEWGVVIVEFGGASLRSTESGRAMG